MSMDQNEIDRLGKIIATTAQPMTSPSAAPETTDFSDDRRNAERWIAAVVNASAMAATSVNEVDKIIVSLETSLASLRHEVARLEGENETLRTNRDSLAHGEKVALELMATAEARVRELEQTDDVTLTAFNKLHRQFIEVTQQFAVAIAQRDAATNALAAAEADKLDAQRYRFLRNLDTWPSANDAARCVKFNEDGRLVFLSDFRLDRAIDTAAAKQGEA